MPTILPNERDWPERLTSIGEYSALVTEGAYNRRTKMLKGWRTMAVAVAIAAVGAVQTAGLATVIPAPYVGIAMLGLGAVMAFLRTLTTTPVGVK